MSEPEEPVLPPWVAELFRASPGADISPWQYEKRGRVTALGLRRRRRAHAVAFTALDAAADEVLPVLAGFEDLQQLRLASCRGIDLAFVSRLDRLWEMTLDGCVGTSPLPAVLPESLHHLAVHLEKPGELQRLLADVQWERLGHLRRLWISVPHGLPPARFDLGFLPQLRSLQTVSLPGVWHQGAEASPFESSLDRLPRSLRGGRISIEAADPEATADALRAHFGVPAPESWGGRTFRPVISVRPLRDEAPEPLVPEWTVFRETDERTWPWWTAGDLVPVDRPDDAERPYARRLAAKVRRVDPELAARTDVEGDSDETRLYARTREDLEALLAIAGLNAAGVVKDHVNSPVVFT